MPIQHRARYRVLSNLVNNSSFGKSSLTKYPTYFLSMSLVNDNQILVKYQTTVMFGHQNVYLELRNKYRDDARKLIKMHVDRLVEEYKEAVASKEKLLEPKKEPYEEPPPKTITLKLVEASMAESLETVARSVYSPDQKCYYRIQCIIEVN